jgi:hypothetical protein
LDRAVKGRRKNGEFFWALESLTALWNVDSDVGYISIRKPFRKGVKGQKGIEF